MLKLSFKGNYKRVQNINNKYTIVTLTGVSSFDCFMGQCPTSIIDWVEENHFIEAWYNPILCHLVLKATGKAECSPNDTYNPTIGERLAEARVKIKLYKFMCTLCDKLIDYYAHLIGCSPQYLANEIPNHGLLEASLKYKILLHREEEYLEKLLKEYDMNYTKLQSGNYILY